MAGNTYAGKNLRIRVDGKTIFHATECSFTTSRNMESIASKDTNGEKVTPGNYTWGVSTNFLVANIPTGSATKIATKQILDLYQAGTQVQVQFTTQIAGDVIITGQSFIESMNMSAPTNGVATGDASFKGNGDFVTTVSVGGEIPETPTLPNAPFITSGSTAYIFANFPFSYQIYATNSPTSYVATGLPSGLSINTSTGLISGTPSTGTMSMTVSATNAGGTTSLNVVNVVLNGLPPTAPSNLVASNIQTTQFSLNFTQSTFNDIIDGDNIEKYEFYKNNAYYVYDFGNSNGKLMQVLTTGTTNLWKIRAKAKDGQYSDFSPEISVTQL